MVLLLLGLTAELIGALLIVYMVLSVHYRIQMEHEIDSKVSTEMSRERKLAIIGVTMMIVGFVLQVASVIL